MKRILICLLVFGLLGVCLAGCSGKEETTEETETTVEAPAFYKITDGNKVLSIELEADPESGYNWTYEISDESILTLSSFTFNSLEDKTAEAEAGEDSTGTMWTATFSSPANKSGNVQLKLYAVQKEADPETSLMYTMDIAVTADGKLSVKAITQ